ncbi:hypothetical protein GQ55_5G337900 [Panicum hallii var. hallii]|uniref:Uncharacterized protein n=1 Tax=Panicum hallii var. hallii TaxID=1504633 RepID=A0A2T7DM04_9POAL|nr:hypothetical protein GQ55_5G337900 [Panicum hallii var. hallii]
MAGSRSGATGAGLVACAAQAPSVERAAYTGRAAGAANTRCSHVSSHVSSVRCHKAAAEEEAATHGDGACGVRARQDAEAWEETATRAARVAATEAAAARAADVELLAAVVAATAAQRHAAAEAAREALEAMEAEAARIAERERQAAAMVEATAAAAATLRLEAIDSEADAQMALQTPNVQAVLQACKRGWRSRGSASSRRTTGAWRWSATGSGGCTALAVTGGWTATTTPTSTPSSTATSTLHGTGDASRHGARQLLLGTMKPSTGEIVLGTTEALVEVSAVKEEWVPLTKLGQLGKTGKLHKVEEVYLHSLAIKEHQVLETLVPGLMGLTAVLRESLEEEHRELEVEQQHLEVDRAW